MPPPAIRDFNDFVGDATEASLWNLNTVNTILYPWLMVYLTLFRLKFDSLAQTAIDFFYLQRYCGKALFVVMLWIHLWSENNVEHFQQIRCKFKCIDQWCRLFTGALVDCAYRSIPIMHEAWHIRIFDAQTDRQTDRQWNEINACTTRYEVPLLHTIQYKLAIARASNAIFAQCINENMNLQGSEHA